MMISVGLGLAAVVLVNLYISAVTRRVGRTIRLLRAVEDLDPTVTLRKDHFEAFDFPAAFEDGLPDAVPADQLATVEGARVNTRVLKGQILLWSHLYHQRRASLANKVPPGRRAVSVKVTRALGVQKNDFVDLYGRVRLTPGAQPVDVLVLRCVKVLDVAKNGTTLTIELTPDEADTYWAIEKYLENELLRPSLRNPQDILDYKRRNRFGDGLGPLLEQIEQRRRAAAGR